MCFIRNFSGGYEECSFKKYQRTCLDGKSFNTVKNYKFI